MIRCPRALISIPGLMAAVLFARPLNAQRADSVPSGERADSVAAPVRLAPISVIEEAGREYRVERSAIASKVDMRLRDVPQSVSVVPVTVISDQLLTSLDQVAKYVPGVTMGQGEGHRDAPTIRGISSSADLFVDGVRDDAEYFRDLYNIERVEVPKGANALIFGRGLGGGLINRVTKAASWTPFGGMVLVGGLHDHRRVTADGGRGFGPRVAGRVNGVYENSGSYRNHYQLDRYGVAPTVTVTAGKRTSVRLSYEHFEDHRTVDRGVPSFQGRPLATDPAAFFGNPDLSYSDAAVNNAGSVIEHRSGTVTVRNTTRFTHYDKFYSNVLPGPVTAAGTEVTLTAYSSRLDRTNLFNQTDLGWAINTGRVRQQILLGAEAGRQRSDAFRATGYFNNTATALLVPVSSPVSTVPVTFRQSASDADAYTTAMVAGVYLQDQVSLGQHVLLLGGIRYDRFELQYHDNRTGNELARTDHLVSPRAGLVIKPSMPISLYASYGVSSLPGSGNQFTSLTVTTQTLEPERFTNYEIGAKWDVPRGPSLTAAVYWLDRTNTVAPDPTNPARTVQTGSQRSEGIELGLGGNVTRNLHLLAGYGYQNVRITSRTAAAMPGAIVPLTPRHQASLWSRYDVSAALGLGLGLIHQASSFTAIDGAVSLPAFTRADAAIFFRVSDQIRLQLNGENLFNTTYYPTAHNNNNITPGSPRAVRAGFEVRY